MTRPEVQVPHRPPHRWCFLCAQIPSGRSSCYTKRVMYKKILKPLFFLLPPDAVHNMMVACGKVVQRIAPVRWLLRTLWRRDDPRLSQSLLGIEFRNPVGLSAGFDKNIELTPLMESVGFGFEIGGSVTMEPRKGNNRPWFYRLPNTKSIVVYAGMANVGLVTIKGTIERNQPRLQQLPLSVSVAVVANQPAATTEMIVADVVRAVQYIVDHKLSQMIEVNISCPNINGANVFCDPALLEQLLAAVDAIEKTQPVFLKMPHLSDTGALDAMLAVIVRHNVQVLTVANLVKDRTNVALKDELPDTVRGGLSGAPTREHNLAMVRHIYAQHGERLVIIGVGGIFTAADAYETIKAGASLVAMVTGVIFEGPQVIGKINKGLVRLLEQDGFRSLSEAVGSEHKKS